MICNIRLIYYILLISKSHKFVHSPESNLDFESFLISFYSVWLGSLHWPEQIKLSPSPSPN